MKGGLRLSFRGTLRFCTVLLVTAWLWWYFRSYFLLVALVLIVFSALASVFLFGKRRMASVRGRSCPLTARHAESRSRF